MKEFECPKCKSHEVFMDKSGNNTGLYCAECGRWITWLNKDQIRLAERQIASNKGDALKDILEKLSESSLDEVKIACKCVGVDISDGNGNYRGFNDVLRDLTDAFNN